MILICGVCFQCQEQNCWVDESLFPHTYNPNMSLVSTTLARRIFVCKVHQIKVDFQLHIASQMFVDYHAFHFLLLFPEFNVTFSCFHAQGTVLVRLFHSSVCIMLYASVWTCFLGRGMYSPM